MCAPSLSASPPTTSANPVRTPPCAHPALCAFHSVRTSPRGAPARIAHSLPPPSALPALGARTPQTPGWCGCARGTWRSGASGQQGCACSEAAAAPPWPTERMHHLARAPPAQPTQKAGRHVWQAGRGVLMDCSNSCRVAQGGAGRHVQGPHKGMQQACGSMRSWGAMWLSVARGQRLGMRAEGAKAQGAGGWRHC